MVHVRATQVDSRHKRNQLLTVRNTNMVYPFITLLLSLCTTVSSIFQCRLTSSPLWKKTLSFTSICITSSEPWIKLHIQIHFVSWLSSHHSNHPPLHCCFIPGIKRNGSSTDLSQHKILVIKLLSLQLWESSEPLTVDLLWPPVFFSFFGFESIHARQLPSIS